MSLRCSATVPGDYNPASCRIDELWYNNLITDLAIAPIKDTAREACATLGPLGVDVHRLDTALEAKRLRGDLPSGVPEEDGLIVYSYCMNNPPVFQFVSRFMNDPIKRVGNASLLQASLPWQKKLDVAIEALPESYNFKGKGWRGMKYAFTDVRAHFPIGQVICWCVFKSITTDPSLMEREDFCGPGGLDENGDQIKRTIFVITNARGKRVCQFSPFPDEAEVLLQLMHFFKVTGVTVGDQVPGSPFEHADIIELTMLDWEKPRTPQALLDVLAKVRVRKGLRPLSPHSCNGDGGSSGASLPMQELVAFASVERLSDVVPDGDRNEYKQIHDHVENVVDLSCVGGGKGEFAARYQNTSGSVSVVVESDVKKFMETALRPLRDHTGDNLESDSFYQSAVRHAELVVLSGNHMAQEECFQCEYSVPGGRRILAIFVVQSKRVQNERTGVASFALLVAMFADVCTLSNSFCWNPGHLEGIPKDQTLKWMKWKLSKEVESQLPEFKAKVLLDATSAEPLQSIELLF